MAFDMHMHLENGRLSSEYLAEFIAAAQREGLEGIGVSEHLSNFDKGLTLLSRNVPERLSQLGWDTDEYIRLVKGSGAIAGLEVDYIPETEQKIRSHLKEHSFDYHIGSVHWIGEWFFDWSPDSWEGKDVEEAWRQYFALSLKAVSSGLFDIFAHPDIIKIFGNKPGAAFNDELTECYRALVRSAAENGTCIEVSSAGLRKVCGEIYPDMALLREAKLAGAEISLASDAHFPEHVGYEFARIIEYAKSAGYEWAATFSNRKRIMKRL
jgi:histidinol-phosphatase (PHP family)